MSSATWPATRGRAFGPTSRLGTLIRTQRVTSITLGAALCTVPMSIAVSETFLGIALAMRVAEIARHAAAFRPPRIFWFWLVWAGLETAAWLHSPDLAAGSGEMRHLLLIAALFLILPSLDRAADKVLVWKGIFAAATLGSASVILGFFVRMAHYRLEVAAGGDPAFYLRSGGLLHHWMIYTTVEILVFPALLEYRVCYPEKRCWTNPALAIHAVAILLSLTRSLWLGAFVVLFLHLVRRRSNLMWVVPLVSAMGLLLTPVRHRVAETFRPNYYSNAERLQMVHVGWQMILEKPLFGVGAGRVEKLYTGYLAPGQPIPAYHGHLHNNALQLGAQFGLVVLGAAMIFVAALVRAVADACNRSTDCAQTFLCRSGLLGLIGFLVVGMMDYTYGHSLGLILFAFAVISPVINDRRSAVTPILDRPSAAR
jgi:O-antigen ligase